MSTTHRTGGTVRLTPDEFDRVAQMAALEADRVAQLELSTDPRDLLAQIQPLHNLADVAQWALSRGRPELTAGGREALARIRQIEQDDLQRVLDEVEDGTSWEPEDIEWYRESVDVVDRATSLAGVTA